MDILTIDFETFYSREFSLSKLTTEEYVRSDEFEVIGVAIKVNNDCPQWFSGDFESTKAFLARFDWDNSIAVAHNALFDGAVLTWKFGIKPYMWVDTLAIARAIDGAEQGNSLKKLAERYRLGVKGTEVLNALGKRRKDFATQDLAQYGEYCKNDVELTFLLFNEFAPRISEKELEVISITTKMFSEPVLELDIELLEQHLEAVRDRKAKLLEAAEADRETLMSNGKFADLLKSIGVDPPRKISPITGKETWAFAKTDEGFKALLEHENETVQVLASARLGTKSTLEESRTERFINIAKRGCMPVPLRYYAAHTGRWGGDDKLNLQNLPARGSNTLKNAILAPSGYVIVDADSSQIEARILAWLAGQKDLEEAFASGKDVYRIMAGAIYNKDPQDITKEERFVGKTTILGCFGADTKILTSSGWKRIIDVQVTDMVWDGEEWVTHQGVVPKGIRTTIRAWGVDATPEHEILTEHGWREWREVITNPILSQSAFDRANLPCAVKTWLVEEKSKAYKKKWMTYDIAYAGSRNRFTIATSAGPLIVHNCGYGMGADKFKTQLMNFGVTTSTEECQRIISVYRQTYQRIPELWKQGGRCLDAILQSYTAPIGVQPQALCMDDHGFLLPNGFHIKYNDLRKEIDGYTYKSRAGRTKIYGGKVIENLCQSLARCVIAEQILAINKKYKVVLTVHDAVACVVPETEAEEAKKFVRLCMQKTPNWARGLPLDCEVGCARSYGEC